ncbi:DNA repair protein RadA [Candidatus Daviesbacteria bacterium RIFCSPHIGHO2_01_FULL_41_45]|uniref:DNA repair protein RadA n=1 Tax=Candidatus Daviesbacteria bacterium RIFCSPLOWO2_01_FULL_40_24 TaxID=1797787 RepID=A0A1F5MID1_9BACT|nr:MAG: DNA repair protein RadA [Candidatus Daviesbacteria bacterium RIFCSPHIGHO2_01_FULL_41_45]OGE65124.1 MAG: DNA repair protein RadA [Candidatus Daviesbacteria bacterium RIFCSPLOWO2_01_FULL_40_24]
MAKLSSLYVCQQCGYQSPTFLGRCPECGSWSSLVEQISTTSSKISNNPQPSKSISQVINLSDITNNQYERLKSSLEEFDRVLGGGLVLGSIILISGDPGIGKSTLLTQVAINLPGVLYMAGEESAQQIKLRVDRIKAGVNLAVLNEVDVDAITTVIEKMRPKLVIIDSIQTLQTQDMESAAGSVSQVRESANRLQRMAKSLHIPILLVGHVTKEGTVAGPKTLEHLVDVVLSLEGEATSSFRILRSSKNRFGPTDEVGIFEMEEQGLKEVKNPSKIFLENKVDAPGSVVVASLNGYRPILVEIQALVTKSYLPSPRRSGSGVDLNRLQLLVAVLQKRLGLPLFDQDIFVNVTGGLKVFEPAVDLGICAAIVSSLKDQKVKPGMVLVGEVGLLGELRAIRQLDKRVNEAKKLGFTSVIAPPKVSSLSEAIKISLQ